MNVTNEELRALKPLLVAVVGPTNEGKTSILRTLTSDPDFGLVNAYNGTTARAEIQKIFYKGIVEILQLVDTPGFQNSSEIYEMLMEDDAVAKKHGLFDLDDVLRVVPRNDDDFRHDLRAWREVERCDVVILVVNMVENPKQSLLKFSLALLKNIGKPVVVAYNNVHADQAVAQDKGKSADYRKEWDEALRKNSFFLVQEYDAHRRSFNNEVELFEKLAALARESLTQRVLRLEIKERRARELRRLEKSRRIIAELLLDVAAYRLIKNNVEKHDSQSELERLEENLKMNIVKREHEAQTALLSTWGFHVGVLEREMLVVDDSANEAEQLLGTEAKRHVSVGGGSGAAIGAAIGGVVDALTLGGSFGAGMLLGGFIGGLVGGGGALAYNSKYDAKGKKLIVRAQKSVSNALLARGVELVKNLQTRGKALDDAVQALVKANAPDVKISGLNSKLDEFALQEEYSKMNEVLTSNFSPKDWRKLPVVAKFTKGRKTREQALDELAEILKRAIPDFE